MYIFAKSNKCYSHFHYCCFFQFYFLIFLLFHFFLYRDLLVFFQILKLLGFKIGPHPAFFLLYLKKNFRFDVELEEVINFQQEIIKIVLDVLKEEKAST